MEIKTKKTKGNFISKNVNWKLYVTLLIASILGAIAIWPYTFTSMDLLQNLQVPLYVFLAGQIIQAMIMYAIIICCTLEFFHGAIIELFLGSSGTADAMNTGNSYLIFMGWFFCLIGFKNAVDGLLRGAGDMKMFTIANLVNLMIRVTLAMALAPRFGIAFVWYAVPIGWFANWALSFTRYRAGTWQSEIIIRND